MFCVAGVLLELGLEKEPVTKQRAEQHVLKLDTEAQARFKAFLQNSFQNPHTLFVLIHDHAHWDLVRSDLLVCDGDLFLLGDEGTSLEQVLGVGVYEQRLWVVFSIVGRGISEVPWCNLQWPRAECRRSGEHQIEWGARLEVLVEEPSLEP